MQWHKLAWLLFLLIGVVATTTVGFNALARAERWGRWWLEPDLITTPRGILKRAKFLLRRPNMIYLWTYLLPLVLLLAMVPIAIYRRDFVPITGFLLGFFIPRAIAYNFVDRSREQIKLWMLVVTVKKVAHFCGLQEAKTLFYELARDYDMDVRIASVNGFMELDPAVGLPALTKMLNDPSALVKAAAKEAHTALSIIATGKGAQKLAPLPKLIQEHQEWKKAVLRGGFRKRQFRRNLRLTAHNIDEIVYSQLAQRLAFPQVYCQTCWSRAAQAAYDDWSWVHCKICGEADALILGVDQVVGQIGGAPQHALVEQTLTVPVWDEGRKVAVAADLDVLEIVAGQSLNYDWAVSAAVVALQHRIEGHVPTTKLRLVGHPPLENNSRLLLQSVTAPDPQP